MPRRPITDGQYQAPDHNRPAPGMEDQAVQALQEAGIDPRVRRLDNMPEAWRRKRHVALPRGCTWARRVVAVAPTARIARDFDGDYLNGQRNNGVVPGDVAIHCIRDSLIQVGVVLPNDLWYRTQFQPIARQGGWGVLVRDHVRGWVVLAHAERIMRACQESILELQAYRARPRAGTNMELERLGQAIAVFQDMQQQITGDQSVLRLDTIRKSFDAWLDGVCSHTQRSRDDVLEVLSLALGGDEDAENNVNVLAEQLISAMTELTRMMASAGIETHTNSENAPVVGLRRGLDELQRLLQVSQQRALLEHIDNAALRVVLSNPVLRQRLANDDHLSQMATRLGNRRTRGLVIDYLEDSYGIPAQGLTVRELQQALRIAGVEGVPDPDNDEVRQPLRRLSRNIRLRRRDN